MLVILPFLCSASLAAAQSLAVAAPTIKLDQAIFTGNVSGSVHQFLGIPFGKSTTGQRRFAHPEPVDAYTGSINATSYGPICPVQNATGLDLTGLPAETVAPLSGLTGSFAAVLDEDCLSVNIIKPNTTTRHDRLPVLVWMYGGGFYTGGSAFYDGSGIVERSLELDEPIIYVSLNYRVSAFGFLGGKEVKEAGVGNVGLLDQRLAFRWIQKYIAEFGGDPEKVTIWGSSAGSFSVASQMIMNGGDTEGLFRGGFMQSGSTFAFGDIEESQPQYDELVAKTGCTDAEDTLACLREVPYAELQAAVDGFRAIFDYQSLNIVFAPRADGVVFPKSPPRLASDGKIANITFVIGDTDDEGTLFSLVQRNVTTDAEFKTYLQTALLPTVPEQDIDMILDLYPSTLSAGSPFDTGDDNALTPQFKRLAALQGDMAFQAPRRQFLAAASESVDKYSFISKKDKTIPYLGAFHTSDLDSYTPGGGDVEDAIIRFTATLNPSGEVEWPKWTKEKMEVLSLSDGDVPFEVIEDTFRAEEMQTLWDILLEHPL